MLVTTLCDFKSLQATLVAFSAAEHDVGEWLSTLHCKVWKTLKPCTFVLGVPGHVGLAWSRILWSAVDSS